MPAVGQRCTRFTLRRETSQSVSTLTWPQPASLDLPADKNTASKSHLTVGTVLETRALQSLCRPVRTVQIHSFDQPHITEKWALIWVYVFIPGPCKPIGVSASQDCLTSIAVVTWQPSNGSDVYTATIQTDTGVSKMCMSDTNKCSFLDLMCGQNFSVSVTASNQQCDVTSGPATSLQSGDDCMATRAGNAGFHCYI